MDKAKDDGSGQCVDSTHPLQSGYEKLGINFYNNIKDTISYINTNGELPAPPEPQIDDGSEGTLTFEEYFDNLNLWNSNYDSTTEAWAIPKIDSGRLTYAFAPKFRLVALPSAL